MLSCLRLVLSLLDTIFSRFFAWHNYGNVFFTLHWGQRLAVNIVQNRVLINITVLSSDAAIKKAACIIDVFSFKDYQRHCVQSNVFLNMYYRA